MGESEATGLVRVAAEKLLEPINDLIQKLAGPAAEEVGLTLRDSVRIYRLGRQIRLFKRVQQMLAEAGIEPAPVNPRVLLPVADYASVEPDDDLQDKWAALIARAAQPGAPSSILPSFIETLKQLSPQEAFLLDRTYDGDRLKGPLTYKEADEKTSRYYGRETRIEDREIVIDHLLQLGLVKRLPWDESLSADLFDVLDAEYSLTLYGCAFVTACRPPQTPL